MNAKTTKSKTKGPSSQKTQIGSLKLLMYSSMLANDKAWLAGFEAAKYNQDLDDNPFDSDADEYKAWESGWWEGFYNEDYTARELSDELSNYTYITADYMSARIDADGNDSGYKAHNNQDKNELNLRSTLKQHTIIKDSNLQSTNQTSPFSGTRLKTVLFLLGIVIVTFVSMNALLIE